MSTLILKAFLASFCTFCVFAGLIGIQPFQIPADSKGLLGFVLHFLRFAGLIGVQPIQWKAKRFGKQWPVVSSRWEVVIPSPDAVDRDEGSAFPPACHLPLPTRHCTSGRAFSRSSQGFGERWCSE